MNEEQRKLFWEIVNCGQGNCLCKTGTCHRIAVDQEKKGVVSFQVPEPWNGDVQNAKIMMVSINPGLTTTEVYPTYDGVEWERKLVEDYFEHRFDSKHGWVIKREHSFGILQKNGDVKNYQGYWNFAQSIGRRILGEQAEIGKDILLTEMVHCKSQKSSALKREIYNECVGRFFNRVVEAAVGIKAIVVVGKDPINIVSKLFEIHAPQQYAWHAKRIGKREVKVMFVEHNAHGGSAKKVPVCDWYATI